LEVENGISPLKPTKKKKVQKREAHKKAPLKKRTKVNATSLHNLGKSQIDEPMLFFEQRARPPEVACPCSKNKGHTRIKS
jgi:hypothetical protein